MFDVSCAVQFAVAATVSHYFHSQTRAQVTLRLSLGKLTYTHRLFPTEPAEHASRDKPSALISDYVTVKRTGRGRRRFLSTHSFLFFQHLLVILRVKSLSVCQMAFKHDQNAQWQYSTV